MAFGYKVPFEPWGGGRVEDANPSPEIEGLEKQMS